MAAAIAAFPLSVWVVASFPQMALTAALLGAVQGLWFYAAGRQSETKLDDLCRFGLLTGGCLGVLGFPPVFSHASIIAARPTVAVFLLAAIAGGLAAGFVSSRVLATPLRGRRLRFGWRVVIGGLAVLTAFDFHFYWPATVERIASPEVSREEVTNVAPGNARGSAWAGCYQYEGRLPLGTGGESGQLKVEQSDGALKVGKCGEGHLLLGGVDRDGSFRFGAEITSGQDGYRVLWQGKFYGHSLQFKRRLTALNGGKNYQVGAMQLTGTGQLTSCYH